MKQTVNVAVHAARPLGQRIVEYLQTRPSFTTVVAVTFKNTGWWGSLSVPEYDTGVKPDIIVSCLTDHIFTADEIAATPYGIVNLHPAPLPAYRGCNSYSHAILNGDSMYGVTLHYVDEGIDTGPIIAQRGFPIPDDATARQVHDRAQEVAFDLFVSRWPQLEGHAVTGDRVPAQNQPVVRYYRRDSLVRYRRLADHPVDQHDRIVRALTFPPFPLPEGAA